MVAGEEPPEPVALVAASAGPAGGESSYYDNLFASMYGTPTQATPFTMAGYGDGVWNTNEGLGLTDYGYGGPIA